MPYMTSHKKRILDFLIRNRSRHFTIEEIIDALSADCEKPGKSTVYRQISSLLSDGVIRRFEAPEQNCFVYQYAAGADCEHHFHLKCSRCGKLLHMECDQLDEVRLTRYGKLLRSTSLDELPELFNILKGDMSIVGPRPQLVRDMVFMTPAQRLRHSVRPGLTGLAQVSGRNNITWEEKFSFDLRYINDGITLLGDIKIIFMTVGKVFKREDTVREGTASDLDFGDYLLQKGEVTEETYAARQEEAKQLLGV